MLLNPIYRSFVKRLIRDRFPPRSLGRPSKLDLDDGLDVLFKLIRTGMQWREVQPVSVSPITVYKHTRRWFEAGHVREVLMLDYMSNQCMSQPISPSFRQDTLTH